MGKKKRNDSHTLSSSAESENAVYIAQMSKTVVQLSLSDSGIEDSDLAEAESSSMSSSQSTNANKKNKKAKKGKNRARTASESNDLISTSTFEKNLAIFLILPFILQVDVLELCQLPHEISLDHRNGAKFLLIFLFEFCIDSSTFLPVIVIGYVCPALIFWPFI